ncbi:MAG: cation transporter [Acidimicrobiia bacterium]|nr:cation transporter [Acidimicrobiia bacterium]
MAAGGSSKAVLAAFFGNSAVAAAKFAAYLFTQSFAMLAESIHSVADAGNQALLLLGARQSRKAADDEHQFGYGIEKIMHPHPIEKFGVALVVLAIGILIEGFGFRTAVEEARPRKGDLSWWQYIRRERMPELPVVLLEDLGAQAGLSIAFVCRPDQLSEPGGFGGAGRN